MLVTCCSWRRFRCSLIAAVEKRSKHIATIEISGNTVPGYIWHKYRMHARMPPERWGTQPKRLYVRTPYFENQTTKQFSGVPKKSKREDGSFYFFFFFFAFFSFLTIFLLPSLLLLVIPRWFNQSKRMKNLKIDIILILPLWLFASFFPSFFTFPTFANY